MESPVFNFSASAGRSGAVRVHEAGQGVSMAFLKRLILVLLVLVVLVYGVIFSVNNNQTVVLDLWLVKLPPIWLSILVIGSFVCGGILGVIVSLFSLVKTGTQKKLLERKISRYEQQPETRDLAPRT